MSDIEFTGERVVPGTSPSDLVAEHRARYEFANHYVKGLRVIDIGCGVGYGCSMLGSVAKNVIGVDISEEAIKHATAKYASGNVEFKISDVNNLPFNDNELDCGVCFEVIEHINKPEKLLIEVVRVIKNDGIFIISTPNGAVRTSSQPNPFHMKEFKVREFREILNRHFPHDKWTIEIYGQFIKGKKYSRFNVALKNLYLGLKGMLGIKPKQKTAVPDDTSTSYEFRTDRVELAEYLVAVLKGKY
jgi:ubiquinone/menaquinone biosynthesis C-methylase UbiE